jgi:hypothetical protein
LEFCTASDTLPNKVREADICLQRSVRQYRHLVGMMKKDKRQKRKKTKKKKKEKKESR